MSSVLDSSAVIAFFTREPGADIVEAHLLAGGCLMHAVNVAEALYNLRRDRSADEADRNIRDLDAFGVTVRADFDMAFLHMVADYKNAPGPTALGDCFGLALAQREGLPFVTSDRHELTRVAARGTVAIDFIR